MSTNNVVEGLYSSRPLVQKRAALGGSMIASRSSFGLLNHAEGFVMAASLMQSAKIEEAPSSAGGCFR